MLRLNRLVLDVLKPHQPNVLEFARAIAAGGEGYNVKLTVLEVDEKTESVEVVVEGPDLELDVIVATIGKLGASLHSIDGVEVRNEHED
jgi:hypothetical protein